MMTSESSIKGTYEHEDGCIYTGQFDNNGIKQGFGVMEMPTGVVYSGKFANGLPNGLGVMDFQDGEKYEGEMMHGWFHGLGCYVQADGMKFEGEFRGGRIWGKGLITFPDGLFESVQGVFQGCKLLNIEDSTETVDRARKIAEMARTSIK